MAIPQEPTIKWNFPFWFTLLTQVLNPYIVLNKSPPGYQFEAKPSDSQLAERINRSILNLYSKFLSEDGTAVDYASMGKSEEFQQFVTDTRLLQQVELENLEEVERKAFFFNIYNALVIHGYISEGIPTGTRKRMQFYQAIAYKIGEHAYSLDDIEHGVLRGNRRHPFLPNLQFHSEDPRKKFTCPLDARLHFALVCGAKSCPPIRVYKPSNLENALELAAKNFCSSSDNFSVDINNKVFLSEIFKWYSKDFGNDHAEILAFISKFLNEQQKEALQKLGAKPAIEYVKYNWTLNSNV